jgi:sugar phosphate isomerase/epimerase
MVKVGFSTTVIGSNLDLNRILKYEPACLELCNYSPVQWPTVVKFVKEHSLPIGIHCPLPHYGWPSYFEITGPHYSRQKEALELVQHTLEAAKSVDAKYIVVHFPSTLPSYSLWNVSHLVSDRYINNAIIMARKLVEISKKCKVPILIENVGPNPFFYSGDHYRALFEEVDGLSMCLDFGHAHVLPMSEDVYQFTEKVSKYVTSVHLYNTRLQDYHIGVHHPPYQSFSGSDGWMDIPRLLEILSRHSSLHYLIFEYTTREGWQEDNPACTEWIRNLVKELWLTNPGPEF